MLSARREKSNGVLRAWREFRVTKHGVGVYDDEQMTELLTFLASAIAISLSGVMAPGAITAATLGAGTRHRHAGAMIAIGHAVVEVPLVVGIVLGLGTLIQRPGVKIGIGLAGGMFLLLMAWGMARDLRKHAVSDQTDDTRLRSPLVAGIILSASNPYFLLWWATVGLALTTRATELGMLAFVLFVIIHWLLDLIWLEILSQASWRGTQVFSVRAQPIVLRVCAAALGVFGIKFIIDASVMLHQTMNGS
jgi:threonine/homoserine/homoserine lactone efflux protein